MQELQCCMRELQLLHSRKKLPFGEISISQRWSGNVVRPHNRCIRPTGGEECGAINLIVTGNDAAQPATLDQVQAAFFVSGARE